MRITADARRLGPWTHLCRDGGCHHARDRTVSQHSRARHPGNDGGPFAGRGADLNVTNTLLARWGRLITSREDLTGRPAVVSNDTCIAFVNEEYRHNRLGRFCLLNLRAIVELFAKPRRFYEQQRP